MQSRTILVLRLIPDKGRSKALPLFIAMRGISNNFLVHLPSWHDELRVCKEKQIKLLLMFQNVIRLEKTSNSESVSLPVWRLEIFCWGDMKKNLIKGRSLESVWSLLKMHIKEEYHNGLSAIISHQVVLYYDNIVLLRYNKWKASDNTRQSDNWIKLIPV